jgi:sensor domain CHASE-containing protein
MNLRGKTLPITAITLAALTIIAFFSARVVLHRGFAGVEAEEARKNTIRAVNALRNGSGQSNRPARPRFHQFLYPGAGFGC